MRIEIIPSLKKKTLLLAAMLPAAVVCVPANAAMMHTDVSIKTYTDFGQNMGRYAVGNTNALLNYLNADGVKITYTGGQEDYTLLHGMIDFSSQNDAGYGAAIGYNFYATVQHNGVHNNTFTGNYIGSNYAIHYQGIEYRTSANNTFLLTPSADYKITRQSKIITDVTGSTVYSGATDSSLKGELLYRSGSGAMGIFYKNGTTSALASYYVYITGGIEAIEVIGTTNANDGSFTTSTYMDYTSAGVNSNAPLPYAARPGDSGSPTWIWNESTGQYEYLNATQSIYKVNGSPDYNASQSRGATEWTMETMASFDQKVEIGSDNVVYVNGVTIKSDTTISDSTNGVSTTPYSGTVTNAAGETLTSFIGVQSGINTWNDLSGLKDTDNWYAYGAGYLNASSNGSGKDLNYADLFMTENLVFVANSATETQQVILNANVDLGIGYVQFSKAEGAETAKFTVSSTAGQNYLLNSAGYVVDKDVEVHLQLTNPSSYMREWRKIGDGDLYIEGSGNNDALLNLGGNGATYLNRENGYAAYNVLANNGTTVVINDIGQIYRDFTFGFRGGVLDMNGNSMEWNNDNAPDAEGFTIHALDEGAIIANRKAGTTTTLTWTQGGSQTWLGSFQDTENAALKFVYDGNRNNEDGAASSVLTMHGIYTNLLNNADSGIEVQSGKIVLVGTNTVHAKGSLNGYNANRYSSTLDWHYADMASNVEIKSGAEFELGSHARLTGDVTVRDGGTFTMREGVQRQYEYIEGGYVLEDTYQISAFYGLHGNVALDSGATMKVEYSTGTNSNTTYAGNISGAGSLTVNTGTTGGTFTLSGDNSGFTGTREILFGGVIATKNEALGSSATDNRWVIGEQAFLASHGFTNDVSSANILDYIDGSSSGVLALMSDRAEQFDLTGHENLIIGAMAGTTIQYGEQNTDVALKAVNGQWILGGGGGELVVNFKLSGDNDLILGNEYGNGVVTLTNTKNDFTGEVRFVGGVTLSYEAGALSTATVDLSYTNRLMSLGDLGGISAAADGAVMVDKITNQRIDLTNNTELYIGSFNDTTYTGEIALAEGAAYRFGAASGALTVDSAVSGAHDIAVDAQNYSGGTIKLTNISADWTGNVSVIGYDSAKLKEGVTGTGDIALVFTQNGILSQATSVSVSNGGILDLAGTTQTLNSLNLGAGGTITDSVGTGTLTVSSGTTSGSINVAVLEKTGADTLTLGGTNYYDLLSIKEGTVQLGSSTALSSGGITDVQNGATLALNGYTNNALVLMENGSSVNASKSGSAVGANGSLLVIGDGTNPAVATVNCGSAAVFTGDIGAQGAVITETEDEQGNIITTVTQEASTLRLTGTSATFAGATINSAGGILSSEVSTLNFTRNGTQTVGGTLELVNTTRLRYTASSADLAGSITIDRLNVGENRALIIDSTSSTGTRRYTVGWTFHEIEGSGTITWNTGEQATTASKIVLDGENSFSGTFTFSRDIQNSSLPASGSYPFGAFLELAHDRAAQNMTLTLNGKSGTLGNDILGYYSHTARAALTINTENAHVVGLNGNALSHVFAGTSPSASIGSSANAPASTRAAALTITGDGAYTFAGTVGAGASGTTNGISLVMDGAGSQTLSGVANLRDVTALQGTLSISNASSVIGGNVAVAEGATLSIAQTFSLDTGKTFSVLGSELSDASANFTGTLLLNGGELIFSGGALKSDVSALTLGNLQISDSLGSQIIRFTDAFSIDVGVQYQLSNLDWSSLESNITALSDASYLTANFTANSDGLFVSFTKQDAVIIWDGTSENNSWTSGIFGTDSNEMPTAESNVYFTDRGQPEVKIGKTGSVNSLVFDSTQNYSVSSDDGFVITASELRQVGTGTTTLESGVAITGTTTIDAGELVVKSADTLQGDVSGAGTLGVDWSGSGSVSGLGEIGTLHVIGGQYAAATTVQAGTVRVDANGQFWASADQTANFELSGAGWNDGVNGAATLRISGVTTISGNVSLTGNSTILVADAADAGTVSGSVNASGCTLTKAGAGTLTVGNGFSGSLNISDGAVALTGGAGTFASLSGEGNFSMNSSGELTIGDMSGFSGKITKTGTGAFAVGTISETASWRFEGNSLGADINFNNFAGANTTIELVGATGGTASEINSYFGRGENTYAQNFVLTSATVSGKGDYGFYLNNGYSNSVSKFTGKFTGNGKFAAVARTTVTDKFIFAGDMSEFSGGFEIGEKRTIEFSDEGGTTRYADAANVIGTGSVANTGTVIFNYGADHTLGNTITGNGALQKTGAGTLTLTGTVSGGAFTLSEGAVVLDGSSATFSSLGGNGDFSMDENSSLTITNLNGFSGHFTKTGRGTLAISGNNTPATASRWTFIGDALGAGMDFNTLSSSANTTIELIGAKGYRSDGASYLAGGDHTFDQNFILTSDAANGRDYGLSLDNGSSRSVKTFTGAFSGNGKLVLSGDPTEKTVLSGDLSNFSGGYSVSGGRILEFSDEGGTTRYADAANVIGTGSVANTGTVIFNYGADHTIDNTITGTGAIQKTGAGTLTLTGTQTLSGTQTITVSGGVLALTSALLSGNVTVSGGGVLDLTQNVRPDSSGSGYLTISDGATVKLANCGWGANSNFGSNFNNDRITLKNGGVLEITQANTTERSFNVSAGTGVLRYSGTGTSTFTFNTKDHYLALASGTTLSFDVVDQDATLAVEKTIGGASSSTGKIEKTGAGTLALSGSSNYSGGTTILEGTLVTEHANALGSGGIVIDGGQLQIASGVTLAQTAITIVLNESVKTSGVSENARAIAAFALAESAVPAPAIIGNGSLANNTTITLALSEEQQNEIANLTAGSVLEYYLWEPSTVSVGENIFAADGSDFILSGDGWNSEGLTKAYADGILKISSTIPEPSAFGLLAGTLALALACSVRRRRK